MPSTRLLRRLKPTDCEPENLIRKRRFSLMTKGAGIVLCAKSPHHSGRPAPTRRFRPIRIHNREYTMVELRGPHVAP